jgi:hypothetical protein
MRNFELVPQLGSRGGDLKHDWMIRQMLMQPVLKADGMITMGTPEIEPNATKSVPEMMGMPLYSLGFAMTEASGPEEVPAVMNNPQIPTDDGKVRKFLDNCETRFGKRSVAYVR